MVWLDGFYNRLKLTIKPDDVDNSLSDFPVMITLTSGSGKTNFDTTSIFDELGNDNRKKIAVTTSDGTTQCPVEIEYWDAVEERAVLWSKIPTVYSTVDTNLYFYYDATYSGTTTSGNVSYVGEIIDTTYQMVVDLSSEGTYDTTNVGYPCVIKESDTSYKMWYAGSNGSNWRIIYASSTDGINWTAYQVVVDVADEGTYDDHGAHAPFVIKESDTSYKMWYSGADGTHYRIIYATSADGINWSNHQMVLDINQEGTYDDSSVHTPYVIKESDTSYKIWYSGYSWPSNANWRIMYAESSNGTSWSNHQMIINIAAEGTYDNVGLLTPCVIKESDTSYKMWYSGYDGSSDWRIIYAESSNGTVWGNFEMVLDRNSEGTYDTNNIYCPLILEDDLNTIWCCGNDGSNDRILRATYWKNPVFDVWDDNFVAVYHMSQSPAGDVGPIKDSTFNSNKGDPSGVMTSTDLVDGKIGKAIDFDGINDYLDCGNQSSLQLTSGFTCEFYMKAGSLDTHQEPLCKWDSADACGWACRLHSDNTFRIAFKKTGGDYWGKYWNSVLSQDINYYIAFYYPGDGSDPTLWIDSDGKTLTNWYNVGNALNGIVDSGDPMTIGRGNMFTSLPTVRQFDGIIDEVRISNIERTSTWIKVTQHSNEDNLIVFSNFETIRPIFLFNGYVKVEGIPSARTVHLFRRSTGELMDSVVSNASTGYFEVGSYYNDYHFIVILPELDETYDLIAHDKIDPGV